MANNTTTTLPASAADTDVVRALREVLVRREDAARIAYAEAHDAYFALPRPAEEWQVLPFRMARQRASARYTEAQEALSAFDAAAKRL